MRATKAILHPTVDYSCFINGRKKKEEFKKRHTELIWGDDSKSNHYQKQNVHL